MAIGIVKFNLGFRIACTWEQHKIVGGNVFLIQFCHVAEGGNHSKEKLARFGNYKSENKDFETFFYMVTRH
jgi:hypothetical protein